MAKMARGIADDFLSTLHLAFEGPVMVAPAMNPSMWNHPAVRENAGILRHRGVLVIEPQPGKMACGEEGTGRMASVDAVVSEVEHACAKGPLTGRRVLISAGATQEPLDAARHVSSPSTGRMGFAMAATAFRRGAEVTLVSGPTPLETPWGVGRVDVRTVDEMNKALTARFKHCDVLVMSAAVSDARPASPAKGKTKKQKMPRSVAFAPTVDILKSLSGSAGKKRPFLLGFAAEEAKNLKSEGERKLREKNLDALFANPIDTKDAGFASAENEGILLFAGKWERKPLTRARASKDETAEKIWDAIEPLLSRKKAG
jgi:phosphopantothenoylcysteine decarboxylase/phosphopantothenate--cysteine ligase